MKSKPKIKKGRGIKKVSLSQLLLAVDLLEKICVVMWQTKWREEAARLEALTSDIRDAIKSDGKVRG